MEAATPRDVLASTGWLSTVDPELRTAILAAGRLRELDCGEMFHMAGDEKAGMWGLAVGQVGLISAMNAPTATVGYIFRAGDWGGYGPLLGSPRQADVIARTAAVILFVPYAALRRMFRDNPVWWEALAKLALSDVYRFGSWGTDLLIQESRARAAAILLHQAGCRRVGHGPVMVAAAQAELGEMANLSRHPIAKILHDFEARGWITCGYRRIDILDVAALRQVANGS